MSAGAGRSGHPLPASDASDMTVALVYCSRGEEVDNIGAYTARLAGALREHGGVRARLVHRVGGGPWVVSERDGEALHRTDRLAEALTACTAAIVQYNPFSYGRWGFAPWLVRDLKRSRRSGLAPLGLMVHEPFVPVRDARSLVMGTWQRMQLRLLMALTDVAFTSTSSTARTIERWARRPVEPLPIGSNLPDARGDRDSQRRELGVAEDDIVLAMFGIDHVTRLHGHAVEAANRVAAGPRRVVLLNLGFNASPELPGLDGRVALRTPGHVSDLALARHLAAADLFLSPLSDGLSARRTSLTAALQHELPVVGTDGPNTDAWLRDAGGAIRLVPSEPVERFAEAVHDAARLAPQELRERGRAARALYDERLTWPAIARTALSTLAKAR